MHEDILPPPPDAQGRGLLPAGYLGFPAAAEWIAECHAAIERAGLLDVYPRFAAWAGGDWGRRGEAVSRLCDGLRAEDFRAVAVVKRTGALITVPADTWRREYQTDSYQEASGRMRPINRPAEIAVMRDAITVHLVGSERRDPVTVVGLAVRDLWSWIGREDEASKLPDPRRPDDWPVTAPPDLAEVVGFILGRRAAYEELEPTLSLKYEDERSVAGKRYTTKLAEAALRKLKPRQPDDQAKRPPRGGRKSPKKPTS